MAASGEGAMSYAEATTIFNVHVIAERTRYAVNFDGNEADGGTAPTIANQLPGVPVDLPANTFTKTDYRFTGWVVTNNTTSEVIAQEAGHFTMPEAAVTLTAQWEAKTYCALTLRVNGVDQPAFNVERLEDNDLSGHNPEAINGYDFYGWAALSSDVEDEVTEAIATLPNHIFTPAANEVSKTLYAVFKKAESGENKHFVLDYADDVADKSIAYNTEVEVTATDGSEWIVSASKQQSMQINTGKGAYIQVPNCPADIVSIVLTCRTGATATTGFSTTSNGEAIVTATGTTTQTLNFSGVTASAGYIIPYEGNCQITHIDVEYNSNYTYYTTRPVVRYTVTFNANGGANAPATRKTDLNSKVRISPFLPTKDEKLFNGWNTEEGGTGTAYLPGAIYTLASNLSLYAQWRDPQSAELPEEAIAPLSGKFIYTDKGDTAVFSRGNLRYNYGADQWYTAEHQYDVLADANLNFGKPEYTGDIDLFGWSNSKSNYGRLASNFNADYLEGGAFKDWGELFEGETEWRTFSKAEWEFLFSHQQWTMIGLIEQPSSTDTLFALAVFPADWDKAAHTDLFATNQYKIYDEQSEHIKAILYSEWPAVEALGVALLPTGGARAGHWGNRIGRDGENEITSSWGQNPNAGNWYDWVDNVSLSGYYWLSSPSATNDTMAAFLFLPAERNIAEEGEPEDWQWATPAVWHREKRRGNAVRLITRIPRQYMVRYDANGATSGSVPVNENKYLDGATVPVAAKGDLAKEGNIFMGWKFKNQIYQAGETYTISGVKYNEEIVFEAQWQEPQLSEYVLVTKPTQMKAGNKIIIAAAGDYDFAMGTQNSGNYRDVVDVLKTNDGHLYTMANIPVEFTLGITDDGKYTFNDGAGYLCASSSSNNNIGTKAALDDNGKWTITIADGEATVVAQGSYTRNHMRYNTQTGQSRISCYASTNTFPKVSLYIKPGDVEVTSGNVKTEDIAQNSNVIMNQDTLKVTESKELSDLKLGLQAVVNVEEGKTLETKDLTIQSTAGESTQLTGLVENVTYSNFYMEIKFYNDAETLDETTANQWYMISAPFDVALNGGFFQTDGTPMVFGQDFDLFEYDGKKRATTGVTGWARPQGVMHGGHACFIGFNAGQSTTIRLKAAKPELPNPESIQLQTFSGDAANSNWNGIANPTMRHFTLDPADDGDPDDGEDNLYVQVYNNDEANRGYQPYDPATYTYVVGTAFFIQGNQEISILDVVHEDLRAPKRVATSSYKACVRIADTQSTTFANQMYVRASENASASYEAGRDVETLNGTTAKHALIWTNNYGMRLAVENAPLVNNQASYELGLYAPKNGEYRIEVASPQEDADLYLTYEGSIIWNLSESAYPIDLKKGTTEGYGLLLNAKAPMSPTGIENIDALNGANVQKVILDEKVFILRGGKMYDVTGKAVK